MYLVTVGLGLGAAVTVTTARGRAVTVTVTVGTGTFGAGSWTNWNVSQPAARVSNGASINGRITIVGVLRRECRRADGGWSSFGMPET
jgi:hypothetical protein